MAGGTTCATGDILEAAMPYLRRYGRALTGCQSTGDVLAAKARQSARRAKPVVSAIAIRILLFSKLHESWNEIRGTSLSQTAARRKMSSLTANSRETLLLRTIEEFSFAEISEILGIAENDVEKLFEIALKEMPYRNGSTVLIIEDDPMIAMDMSACLSDMGCEVTGVARTAAEAIDLATDTLPEMIIASLVLADKSSGEDAAKQITAGRPDIHVVFATPYPEQLLTGTKQEPVFIIAKPHLDGQVRSAVSQLFILRGGPNLPLRVDPQNTR